MTSISFTAVNIRILGLNPSRATTWHLSEVHAADSHTGRLVRGQVWRRHDGRHWLYKKFIDGQRNSGLNQLDQAADAPARPSRPLGDR